MNFVNNINIEHSRLGKPDNSYDKQKLLAVIWMVINWIIPTQIITFDDTLKKKYLTLYISIAETWVYWHFGKYATTMSMDEAVCIVVSDLIDLFYGNPSIKKIIQMTPDSPECKLASLIGITRSTEKYFDYATKNKINVRPYPSLMAFSPLRTALYRRHCIYKNETLGIFCNGFIRQPKFFGIVCFLYFFYMFFVFFLYVYM